MNITSSKFAYWVVRFQWFSAGIKVSFSWEECKPSFYNNLHCSSPGISKPLPRGQIQVWRNPSCFPFCWGIAEFASRSGGRDTLGSSVCPEILLGRQAMMPRSLLPDQLANLETTVLDHLWRTHRWLYFDKNYVFSNIWRGFMKKK